MSTFKYQDEFAAEMTTAWKDGKQEHVRTVIRGLKNKAQAAFIAAQVTLNLSPDGLAAEFVAFMHPNQ
jgi:hypothetical protein